MPIIRANALRSFQASFRSTTTRATARRATPLRTQLVAKRFNSSGGSGGHGHGEPSSDLPWLLTALVVTPPATWYLWPEESSGHHGGHDDHGKEHAEKADEEEEAPADAEEEEPKEESKEEPKEETKDEPKEESNEEAKKESDDGKPAEKKEESDDGDSADKKEDSKDDSDDGKSADKGEEKKEKKDDKPPADKPNAVSAQDAKEQKENDSDSSKSKLAKLQGKDAQASTSASKPKGTSQGDITVKQGGMSNTDTKHSTDIKSSEKSTKGDGNPETAKSKGTIDPNAPVK